MASVEEDRGAVRDAVCVWFEGCLYAGTCVVHESWCELTLPQNGFQDLFKRFSSNIEHVVFIVDLEPAKAIKEKVVRYAQQHRPAHLTYWGIVKTHYIPPVDRLEKFAVKLAKDLPRLRAFEMRVEDEKVDPEPLVRYTAYTEGPERVLQKVYKHRMPKGYPDAAAFWEGLKPETLWP